MNRLYIRARKKEIDRLHQMAERLGWSKRKLARESKVDKYMIINFYYNRTATVYTASRLAICLIGGLIEEGEIK